MDILRPKQRSDSMGMNVVTLSELRDRLRTVIDGSRPPLEDENILVSDHRVFRDGGGSVSCLSEQGNFEVEIQNLHITTNITASTERDLLGLPEDESKGVGISRSSFPTVYEGTWSIVFRNCLFENFDGRLRSKRIEFFDCSFKNSGKTKIINIVGRIVKMERNKVIGKDLGSHHINISALPGIIADNPGTVKAVLSDNFFGFLSVDSGGELDMTAENHVYCFMNAQGKFIQDKCIIGPKLYLSKTSPQFLKWQKDMFVDLLKRLDSDEKEQRENIGRLVSWINGRIYIEQNKKKWSKFPNVFAERLHLITLNWRRERWVRLAIPAISAVVAVGAFLIAVYNFF